MSELQAMAVSGEGGSYLPPFAQSRLGTMGIELELMVLDRLTYDLFPAAPDILDHLEREKKAWAATPEITTSMLEVATSILDSYGTAAEEVEDIRRKVNRAAFEVGAAISGGGAHPFQKWSEQRIYPKPRYFESQRKFGYLAKLFTVFGMHVHIGVGDSDEAIRLCAWLTQRAPLFLALSANSPCWQGEDSGFCSARSNVVGAFPMSGTMPAHVRTWNEFRAYFDELAGYGIVNSIKDFYWDVRPKPEYGTIELRVLDTPLRPIYAAALASYARELCLDWSARGKTWPKGSRELYVWNRFNAARDGVEARWIDPETGAQSTVAQAIRDDLTRLSRVAQDPQFSEAAAVLKELLLDGGQAGWLRKHLASGSGMNDLARRASELFEQP